MSEENEERGDREPVPSENKRRNKEEPPTFTHNDYTVGWICALPKEHTAASAMLDQRHARLLNPPNDHNTYSLGSIGDHNIVIACLPKGKYGNNSSATVAARMVGTFPSIKFGLMVGIGGGIPPMVRLGDVVVSTPVDQYPGVVQYDFGKMEDGGNFRRTGALNNPPSALLTALASLEAEHPLNGSKVLDYLAEMERKWPKLAPKYVWSDTLKDPLFAPDNSHHIWSRWQATISILWEMILALLGYLLGWWAFPPIDRGTEQVEDTLVDGRAQKPPRDMRVHYGLIASGNQVVKDAAFRDRLNDRFGGKLLCIDMEAAGLMNDFPCLVIRGICDYADSRKNKDWQEYTAAVAAAFTKELLFVVPAQKVEHMPAIKVG
jgi:nucleoside phosphorylase